MSDFFPRSSTLHESEEPATNAVAERPARAPLAARASRRDPSRPEPSGAATAAPAISQNSGSISASGNTAPIACTRRPARIGVSSFSVQ